MENLLIKDSNGNPLPSDWDSVKDEISRLIGLVGMTEIADRAGVQANTVKVWRQRHADFPEPIAQLAIGPVWSWHDVEPWVERQKQRKPGPRRD